MTPAYHATEIEALITHADQNGMTDLGQRLSALRLQADQSFQQVADAVGVSKAHIWELEKGRAQNPSMDLVRRLADHFGASVSFLVGESIDAPDADPELQRMFRQAQQLDERERQILDEMMQALLRNRAKREATVDLTDVPAMGRG